MFDANGPAQPLPGDDESKLVGAVLDDFERAKRDRQWLDHLWWVLWQWYGGVTNVFFDALPDRRGQVYTLTSSQASRKNTSKPINFIGHAVDLTVAKQTKSEPTFDVKPVQQEAKSRLAARAARDTVRHIYSANGIKAQRRGLTLNRVITGNGFQKVFFDRFRPPFRLEVLVCPQCHGAKVLAVPLPPEVQQAMQQAQAQGIPIPPPPEQPCPVCGGQGELNNGKRPLGDVAVCGVSPWEIYPAPGVKKIEEGCFHAWRMSKDAASAAYGVPMEKLSKLNLDENRSEFERYANARRPTDEDENMVWVVERWYPPAPGREAPRCSIVVGNALVFPPEGHPTRAQGLAEIPEPYGRIPIFHFRQRPVAEEFWSDGVVLQMISANDFVNRARANFHRHMQTMAFVKWVYQKGSVPSDQITNIVGERIEFTGSDAPRQLSPAQMPEFYTRLMDTEIDNIYKLPGLHDIDRGVLPPNVEAAEAMHLLIEKSETVFGPILEEDTIQWQALALAALVCAKQNYKPTDVRLARIGGKLTSKLEVAALLEADLSDNVDVRCEIGGAIASSQALRHQSIFKAIEVGMIDAAHGARLMEFGATMGEEDFDDHRLQESVAIQENDLIAQNQPHTALFAVDDHECHLREHRMAAAEARLAGNMPLAIALDAAAQQHLAFLQPPTPSAPVPGAAKTNGTGVPFDAAAQSGQPPS